VYAHVFAEPNCQLEDDPLMPSVGRRRHQQLAVDQLVARRGLHALFSEAVDFFDRPAVLVSCGHGHKVLGAVEEVQLGMRQRAEVSA
jgi:hypothetical protein